MRHTAPWMAAALIVGTAAGVELAVDARLWLAALAVGWSAAAIGLARAWPATVLAGALVGCLGAGGALGDRAAREALAPPIAQQVAGEDGPVQIEGVLRADAEPTAFGAGFSLDLTHVWLRGQQTATSGGVRVTVGGERTTDVLTAWRTGRVVRTVATLRPPQPYRNFGTPHQEARTALRGIRLFGSVKSASLVDVRARGAFWQEAAASVRAHVRRAVHDAIGARDPQAAAIVIAVLIGDRAGLDPEVEARLQRAGTFHVIAISGGNIAVLVGALLWVMRRAGCSPRLQAGLALAGLAAYALVVAAGSSVARATIAASLYLVARALDHRSGAWAVVASTAGLVVLVQPLVVLDAGFWLTFVASIAILDLADTIAERLARLCGLDSARGRFAGPPILLFAATIAAEGSLAPITAYVFSQVTAAGLLLNFAAVPLMTVVQMAGLVLVALATIHAALAIPAATVAVWAARGIIESARAADLATWTAPHVPPPPFWLVVSGVALWWFVWRALRPRTRRIAAVLWIGAMTAIVTGRPIARTGASWLPQRVSTCEAPSLPAGAHASAWLRVTFLDVGQGSSTLVRFPDGESILVDAGGSVASRFDVGRRIVSPALWALGRRRLSAVALSHGDLDHIGGAGAVIGDFAPREVWEGVPVPSSEGLRQLASQAAALGVGWVRVTRGMSRQYGGVHLRAWNPPAPDWERPRVRNDDSIVLELRYGDVSIVLPGDIGSDVERTLEADFAPARHRVLAAAHHGSRQSTTDRFLEALKPDLVVISAGRDNRHGHPAPQVLARLNARQIRVLRTDRDGAIALDTDGRDVLTTTYARCAPERPGSTTNEASVVTGAPGFVTKGTMR